MTVDHAYQIAYAEALSDAWLDDLAPRVGRVYGRALRLWVAHCAIAGLDPLDNSELELFLTGLDERYAVATIETFRCGVVAFHDQLGGEPGHELEHIASALELARTADVNTMAASYPSGRLRGPANQTGHRARAEGVVRLLSSSARRATGGSDRRPGGLRSVVEPARTRRSGHRPASRGHPRIRWLRLVGGAPDTKHVWPVMTPGSTHYDKELTS